mmetsp:Transcript_31264/g.75593  ORF Transcript_31264/g.75593 Transcript_31264/m.75593 type:complete len:139 (-) Transcript_31264:20-436(-)
METNTALWLEVNCSERDSFRCHSQFGLFGFFFFLTRCFIVYTTTLFPACGQSREGKGAKKRTVQGQEEKQSQEQAVLYYRGRAGRRDPTRPQRRSTSTRVEPSTKKKKKYEKARSFLFLAPNCRSLMDRETPFYYFRF